MKHRLRAGELEAVVVPGEAMLVAALRHRGEDVLAQRPDEWTGSPLLHPWANRVSVDRIALGGRTIEAFHARRDERGVLLHGFRRGAWVVEHADDASVRAHLDWDDPAFPFPHRVTVEHRLGPEALTTTTEVGRGQTPPHSLVGVPGVRRGQTPPRFSVGVPVAFGWHPFLRLPGEPRERWRVTLGARTRLLLDDRLLPTGERAPWPPGPFALGDGHFDLGLADVDGPFVLEGERRRIEVVFEEGAPYAQFFAPRDEPVACFEPMAAPANALVTGDGLAWAPWRMRFSIRVLG